MNRRWWRYLNVCYRTNLKLSVVAFIVAIVIGELGCFLWAYLTWRVPASSKDSLGLLLVSDSQIQVFFFFFFVIIKFVFEDWLFASRPSLVKKGNKCLS